MQTLLEIMRPKVIAVRNDDDRNTRVRPSMAKIRALRNAGSPSISLLSCLSFSSAAVSPLSGVCKHSSRSRRFTGKTVASHCSANRLPDLSYLWSQVMAHRHRHPEDHVFFERLCQLFHVVEEKGVPQGGCARQKHTPPASKAQAGGRRFDGADVRIFRIWHRALP